MRSKSSTSASRKITFQTFVTVSLLTTTATTATTTTVSIATIAVAVAAAVVFDAIVTTCGGSVFFSVVCYVFFVFSTISLYSFSYIYFFFGG